MTRRDFPDEILMAYSDGELDEAMARRVAAAVEQDEETARRVALFARTREALAAAARARPLPPVPDALTERVRRRLAEAAEASPAAERVVAFRRPERQRPSARQLALAASVALAVGVAAGLVASLPFRNAEPGGLQMAAIEDMEIAEALAALPAGESRSIAGGEIALIASFLNADGELCREFELDGSEGGNLVSIACHTETGWEARFALAAGEGDGGYVPASSLEALDAYLSAIGAGMPLPADEEASALAAIPGEG